MNVNGLNKLELSPFQHFLSRYHLLAFQETKFSDSDRIRRANHFAHAADANARTFWSHREDSDLSARRGRAGVGLVLSGQFPFDDPQDVTSTFAAEDFDFPHHYLVVKATSGDDDIFIHVIYAPVDPADRKRFLESLPTRFPPGARHIAVGDFNVPLDPLLDELVPTRHDQGRDELHSWMIRVGVMDAWRASNPERRQFTGPSRRNRIDYAFLSQSLFDDCLQSISHVTEDRWDHEDHLPVRFELKAPGTPQQSRLPWKCPRWLLGLPAVQVVLGKTLDQLCERLRAGTDDNPGALLDEHKRADGIFIRQIFHAFKNQDQDRLSQLRQVISDAEVLHASVPSDAHRSALESAKMELRAFSELLESRLEQAKFDRDIRLGETGSSFFFRPPSAPEYRVSIPTVQRQDGSLATEATEMAALHRRFWGSLFQSPSYDLAGSLAQRHINPPALADMLKHTLNRLSPDDQRFLDAPMTANDFFWAIKTSSKNKSSGLDGLPAEYYQLFPEKWAQVYEIIYAAQLARGRMTKFQRRASISLLYKKGDRSNPGNYRPITLLNHDAKFGPKILARRLGFILPKLLHPDQTGFTPGRSIRHALLRFQDLQKLSQEHGLQNAGAVMLDLAKAFDSVMWPALDQVLRHFGFGATFRDTVNTFYSGTLVSVLVNGTASKFFELGCGVRQGDPLSPALFVVFIEPMLNFLRHETGHLGIQIDPVSEPQHLLAFADDCTGFLSDLRNTPTFISAVQRYTKAAGLLLNVDKTAIMPFQALNPTVRRNLETEGLSVVPDDGSTILLGVSQSPTLTTSRRFDRLIPQLVARCLLWRYRARTLRGRAVILRTIILPILWYTAAVTAVPRSVAEQVERLCKAFLFKQPISTSASVRAPMLSAWMYWPTTKGGLGLPSIPHFAEALHLCSLRDAIRSATAQMKVASWFAPAAALMTLAQAENGVAFDILYAQVPRQTSPGSRWSKLGDFWLTTIGSWINLRKSPEAAPLPTHSRLDAPLWDNQFLRVGALRRTLQASSKICIHFRSLGYLRLRDFLDRRRPNDEDPDEPVQSLPSAGALRAILDALNLRNPRLQSLAASQFLEKLSRWINASDPPTLGPSVPRDMISAAQDWRFKGRHFTEMNNRDLYRIIHKLPTIIQASHEALDIQTEPDWSTVWKRDISLDKDLLPILGDLKFRLLHNGLNFRVKYQWFTPDVKCVHGCDTVETAKHLFWDCPLAKTLWSLLLHHLQVAIATPITWASVTFLQDISLSDVGKHQWGNHNFLRVFNVVRCCVLRSLWLHRNDLIFKRGATSSQSFLTQHASCYIRLHIHRMRRTQVENDRLCSLCELMLLERLQPPEPTTPTQPPPQPCV